MRSSFNWYSAFSARSAQRSAYSRAACSIRDGRRHNQQVTKPQKNTKLDPTMSAISRLTYPPMADRLLLEHASRQTPGRDERGPADHAANWRRPVVAPPSWPQAAAELASLVCSCFTGTAA